jgi:hypothetical protein
VYWIGTYLLPVASVLSFAKTPPCSVEEKVTGNALSPDPDGPIPSIGAREKPGRSGEGELKGAPGLAINQIVLPWRARAIANLPIFYQAHEKAGAP